MFDLIFKKTFQPALNARNFSFSKPFLTILIIFGYATNRDYGASIIMEYQERKARSNKVALKTQRRSQAGLVRAQNV